MNAISAVQLSLVTEGGDGVRYVEVLVLRYNAAAIVQHCEARYDLNHPYDHNVVWERTLPVERALDLARSLTPAPTFPAARGQLRQPTSDQLGP
jgi:hypothetical protein